MEIFSSGVVVNDVLSLNITLNDFVIHIILFCSVQ